MSIKFYRTNEKYGCFSNFFKSPFELEGNIWPTSEHYYQARKFKNLDIQKQIRLARTPASAAKMGRDWSYPLRKDWEEIKDIIMYKAVFAKFSDNRDIKEILLDTGVEEIIEDSPYDYYWGCGEKGTGKNMLGKILMFVREELSNNL